MSEPNQMINPDASAIVPLKRKRGRPRKHPRPDLDRVGGARRPRNQNPNYRGEPGFAGVNRSNPHQVNLVINATDYMVGQAVHGVIEATFDAGYLLTVRVGNSPTTLRGVVFKPGHFVPLNAHIDVAPSVQMITRNHVPIPRENYARPRERNGTVHAVRAANLVPSKGKQVPSVVTEISPGIPRGNLVPVVLQPVKLPNGAAGETSCNATLPVQVAASKGKQALDTADPSKGSTPMNQAQAAEMQFIRFESQHNHQEMSPSIQHKAAVLSAETLREAESKGMPFEKLLTDIIKRNQVPMQSTDANTSSAAKLSSDDSSTASDDYDDDDDDDDDEDTDDALSVEPLQAVQPDVRNQPAVGAGQLENYRTGKMTELLQENMAEQPGKQVQNLGADQTPKPNQRT